MFPHKTQFLSYSVDVNISFFFLSQGFCQVKLNTFNRYSSNFSSKINSFVNKTEPALVRANYKLPEAKLKLNLLFVHA